MKKIVAAGMLLAAIVSMAGCGAAEGTATFTAKPTQSTTTTTTAAAATAAPADQLPPVDHDEMKNLYKAPAEVVTIDTAQEDPSTAEMKFLFDNKKRVVGISYMIGEHPIMVNYAYDDATKSVKIIAFAESAIVDEKKIDLPELDESAGFTEKDGYYFNCYKFE